MFNKVQDRIGKLFSIFSLALFIVKLSYHIFTEKPFYEFFILDNISYLMYGIIFWISSLRSNIVSKLVQIGIIFVESILALYPESTSPFFGLMLIEVCFLLSYCYGILNKNFIIKTGLITILLYVLFVFLPLNDNNRKYLLGIEWLVFIYAFLFLVWFIFKDFIIKIEEKDFAEREKLIRLMEETRDIAHDALTAYEKYFNKHKD
jgi:hypothetical protein